MDADNETVGSGIWAIIIILGLFWGGTKLYHVVFPSESTAASVYSSVKTKEVKDCSTLSPNNPYDLDTGHYAGFEWQQENNGYCDGNSDSFNEGCEEYNTQESNYQQCLRDS
jgi:hypothetical protein